MNHANLEQKKCIEIIVDSIGTYNANKQIKFKTATLKSRLCNYGEAYILAKGRITIAGAGANAGAKQADKINKRVIIKSYFPFANSISEVNNT